MNLAAGAKGRVQCEQVLKGLVDRRKLVKGWLKKTTDILKYQQFDIQQQALKLTANRYSYSFKIV